MKTLKSKKKLTYLDEQKHSEKIQMESHTHSNDTTTESINPTFRHMKGLNGTSRNSYTDYNGKCVYMNVSVTKRYQGNLYFDNLGRTNGNLKS
jgi:transposase-like protein